MTRAWRPVLGAVALLAALAACGDDETVALDVTWGAGAGASSCVYDAATMSVEATLRVRGPEGRKVTVEVSAYADENTSDLVGSGTRTVRITGTEPMSVRVGFAVERPPHIGEDDITACRLSFD